MTRTGPELGDRNNAPENREIGHHAYIYLFRNNCLRDFRHIRFI